MHWKTAGVTQYKNISPSKDHWLSCASGVSGITYALIFSIKEVRVEINMNSADKNRNESVYDQFFHNKETIEQRFGNELQWQRLDEKKACRVKFRQAVDAYNEENWEGMILWMVEHFPKLEQAFRPEIEKLKQSKKV